MNGDIRDPRTFEDIYRRALPLLRFLARRYAVPAGEGEELIHDAFLRLFESRGEFLGYANVRSFLVKTLRHMIIDRSRRQKFRRTVSDRDVLRYVTWEEPLADGDMTSQQYEAAVLAVGQMVGRIGAQKGAGVFQLFYSQGLSVREISARTGEPVGSITAKLCRLRKRHRHSIRRHVFLVAGI